MPISREASGGVNRSFCQASELNPYTFYTVNPALQTSHTSTTTCDSPVTKTLRIDKFHVFCQYSTFEKSPIDIFSQIVYNMRHEN
jgi:hypothetical protein